uniref:Hexose transporter 1 n=1 Tax=Globisporangium ultimum (strain ATCC 200006 / CBS 805.95 / DAOM BR144) TaxID=431595 RepID=K3WE46_GLOUD
MASAQAPPAAQSDKYAEGATPSMVSLLDGGDVSAAFKERELQLKPNRSLYTSVLVALILPLQYGWSTSQLNLSTFHHADECNVRPVPQHRCLMFPGHSQLQWTFVVNAWILGGMFGSLSVGFFMDKVGRKKVMLANCVFMIIGAVIEILSSSIWVFAAGRFVAGVASGFSTGVVGAYINEVTPPRLRNLLGVGLQISITIGILLVGITFFFANTSSGWRYIAAFPILLAGLFLVLTPFAMVESPAWLLMQGRHEDAEKELARLFGVDNVTVALGWLECSAEVDRIERRGSVQTPTTEQNEIEQYGGSNLSLLFSSIFFRQFIAAIGIAAAQQLSGINAVFFYSSDLFKEAGFADDRVGTLVVNIVNVLPTFFSGWLAMKFGNRTMILSGMAGMLLSAIGMTFSLVVSVPVLSIVFTSTYVAAFGVSLGPLVWVVIADLFPDNIRATASSICIGCSWLANLVVGVSYPFIANALNDFSFMPFIGTLALFYAFVFRMVPETSGKTSEEIQAGFHALRKHKDGSRRRED